MEEVPSLCGIAEIDVSAGRQEVGNGETSKHIDEPPGRGWGHESGDVRRQRDRGHANDSRESFHGELAEGLARFAGQHGRKVFVSSQLEGGRHDCTRHHVEQVDGTFDLRREHAEELIEPPHPQRFEHDVATTRKDSVQRCSRNTTFGNDIVDGDLRETPLIDATLDRIEDARFKGGSGHK